MGRIRRGGYVFVTYKGDHGPRHVHVYRDGTLIVKWNLDARVAMAGAADWRLRFLIARLQAEALL